MLIANFLIAVFYFRTASNTGLVTSLEAKTIGVAVAILPLYFARVSLSVLPFTLAHLAFVVAWWMLSKSHRQQARSKFSSVAIALLFAFSFSAESLIVFYFLPLIVTYGQHRIDNKGYSLRQFIKAYWWLLALPLVFLGIRTVFMQPRGVYLNYNHIDLFTVKSLALLFLTFAALVLCLFAFSRFSLEARPTARRTLALAGFSLLTLELATLPYLLVGKIQLSGGFTHLLQLNGWHSRVHLLMGLPIAIGLAALIQIGAKNFPKISVTGASLLVLVSIACTNLSTIQYLDDWNKQTQIIRFLKTDENVQKSNIIFYLDTTKYAFRRHPNQYEYTGMLVSVYGTYDRVSVVYSDETYETMRGTDVAYTYQSPWLHHNLQPPYKAVLIHISTDSSNQIVYRSEVLKW
jgi:hypothetical protein